MTGDTGRRAKTPADHFPAGGWPHESPSGLPVEAYYAAVLARTIDAETRDRAARQDISWTRAMDGLAEDTGVAVSTLWHAVKGDRWPGLAVMAKVEWYLNRRASGLDAVYEHLHRDGKGPADLT